MIGGGPKVDGPFVARSLARERLIDRRPAIGVDLALEAAENLLLAAWPKFQIHELRGAGAKTSADIVAVDDEVGAIVGASARQDVDMRMFGVPMIDCDPIDLGPKIARHLRHKIAREGAKVGKLHGVIRRDDETEMMPVALAPLGEGGSVRRRRPPRRTFFRGRHRE